MKSKMKMLDCRYDRCIELCASSGTGHSENREKPIALGAGKLRSPKSNRCALQRELRQTPVLRRRIHRSSC
jgi:hypothetical protein